MQGGLGLRQSGDPNDQHFKQDIRGHVESSRHKLKETWMKTHEETKSIHKSQIKSNQTDPFTNHSGNLWLSVWTKECKTDESKKTQECGICVVGKR
jgi:hypothetical protein